MDRSVLMNSAQVKTKFCFLTSCQLVGKSEFTPPYFPNLTATRIDFRCRILYNVGVENLSTTYNWIDMFIYIWEEVGTARHGIGTPEVPSCSNRPWFCWQEQALRQNPSLNFKADYIEHHFEARATLPPIFDVCVIGFFSKSITCVKKKSAAQPIEIFRNGMPTESNTVEVA